MASTANKKEGKDQVSFKLASGTKQRIEALATATRRTKTFVIEEAINQYLELNEWQIQSIQRGMKDIEEGRSIPHETLVTKWEAKIEGRLV